VLSELSPLAEVVVRHFNIVLIDLEDATCGQRMFAQKGPERIDSGLQNSWQQSSSHSRRVHAKGPLPGIAVLYID